MWKVWPQWWKSLLRAFVLLGGLRLWTPGYRMGIDSNVKMVHMIIQHTFYTLIAFWLCVYYGEGESQVIIGLIDKINNFLTNWQSLQMNWYRLNWPNIIHVLPTQGLSTEDNLLTITYTDPLHGGYHIKSYPFEIRSTHWFWLLKPYYVYFVSM